MPELRAKVKIGLGGWTFVIPDTHALWSPSPAVTAAGGRSSQARQVAQEPPWLLKPTPTVLSGFLLCREVAKDARCHDAWTHNATNCNAKWFYNGFLGVKTVPTLGRQR